MGSNFGDKNQDTSKKTERMKEPSSSNLRIGESLTGSIKPEASGQSEGFQSISKLASAIMSKQEITKADLQDIVNQVSKKPSEASTKFNEADEPTAKNPTETENEISKKRKYELIDESSTRTKNEVTSDTKRQITNSEDNYHDRFANMTEIDRKGYYNNLVNFYKNKSNYAFSDFKETKDVVRDQDIIIKEVQIMIKERMNNSSIDERSKIQNARHEYKECLERLFIEKHRFKQKIDMINKNMTRSDINNLKEQISELSLPKTNDDFAKLKSLLDASSIIRISHFERKADIYDTYRGIQDKVIDDLSLIQEKLDPSPEESLYTHRE